MAGGSELMWIMAVVAAGLFDGATTHKGLSTGRFHELNWWPRWLHQRCSTAVFLILMSSLPALVVAVAMMFMPPSKAVTLPMVAFGILTFFGVSNAYQLWTLKRGSNK